MKKTLFIILLTIFFSFNSFPGTGGTIDVSGSGHAIKRNGTYQLLDFVENLPSEAPYFLSAPTPNRWESLIYKQLSNQLFIPNAEVIGRKLAEIEQIDPIMAISIFEAMRMYNWNLIDEPLSVESINSILPEENIYQLAKRQGRTIYISKTIWDELSIKNKVGLLFHESISSLLPELPLQRERQIVSYFFSEEFMTSPISLQLQKLNGQLPCNCAKLINTLSVVLRNQLSQNLNSITAQNIRVRKIDWQFDGSTGRFQFLPLSIMTYMMTKKGIFKNTVSFRNTIGFFNNNENTLQTLPFSNSSQITYLGIDERWYSLSLNMKFKESSQPSKPKLDWSLNIHPYLWINPINSNGCTAISICKNKPTGNAEKIANWLTRFL